MLLMFFFLLLKNFENVLILSNSFDYVLFSVGTTLFSAGEKMLNPDFT